ncbi:DUF493 domain-containing protein [Salisaeta longa]|uniref:DUF493 domain-containing protein n=1 Tax=Salisaeta longa TaxID=503170 RepID=UPI0003B4F90D|nr:DUF493 domain-containing protein [Salisaeta longa]
MQIIERENADNPDEWWDRFRELLDEENEWPTRYTFKFIAPAAHVDELKSVFGDHSLKVRASSKGNYLSVTAHLRVTSSDEVVTVYQEAGAIEGVIAL